MPLYNSITADRQPTGNAVVDRLAEAEVEFLPKLRNKVHTKSEIATYSCESCQNQNPSIC